MEIKNFKIRNFRGIKEKSISKIEGISVISGDNGAGKTSLIRGIEGFLSGDFQKEDLNKDYSIEGEIDGMMFVRKEKDEVNGKKVNRGAINDMMNSKIGKNMQINQAVYGSTILQSSPEELQNYIGSFINKKINISDIIKEGNLNKEEGSIVKKFSSDELKLSDLNSLYKSLYNERTVKGREKKAAAGKVVEIEQPDKNAEEISKEKENLLKDKASLLSKIELQKKAINDKKKKENLLKELKELGEQYKALPKINENLLKEKENLLKEKEQLIADFNSAKTVLKTLEDNLKEKQDSLIGAKDKGLCPITKEKCLATKELIGKIEESIKILEESINKQKELISSLKNKSVPVAEKLKKIDSDEKILQEKNLLIEKGKGIKKAAEAIEVQEIGQENFEEKVKEIEEKISLITKKEKEIFEYDKYLKNKKEASETERLYKVYDKLVKTFSPKGELVKNISEKYLKVFNDQLILSQKEMGIEKLEIKLISEEGVKIKGKTPSTPEFIDAHSLSRGEQMLAEILLMDVFNKLTELGILIIDDAESLDMDNFKKILRLVEKNADRYNIVLISTVLDVKNIIGIQTNYIKM